MMLDHSHKNFGFWINNLHFMTKIIMIKIKKFEHIYWRSNQNWHNHKSYNQLGRHAALWLLIKQFICHNHSMEWFWCKLMSYDEESSSFWKLVFLFLILFYFLKNYFSKWSERKRMNTRVFSNVDLNKFIKINLKTK